MNIYSHTHLKKGGIPVEVFGSYMNYYNKTIKNKICVQTKATDRLIYHKHAAAFERVFGA